jgi:acetyl esterase/lipase
MLGEGRGATFDDILALPSRPADERVAYGPDPQQFGELRLPARGGRPHPVVVVIHGGCWEAKYDLSHAAPLATAIADLGLASWSLEYRRLGQSGGGWPGTFLDAGHGIDALRTLALAQPLDLSRVIAVGHSAGGHLALWCAGRRRVASASAVFMKDPLRLRGVVALGAITDLRAAFEEQVCGSSPGRLVDGPPDRHPDRYAQASPAALIPLRVPQRLVHGSADTIVPPSFATRYADAARAKGDAAEAHIVDGASHFDVISPRSEAWSTVAAAIEALALGRGV